MSAKMIDYIVDEHNIEIDSESIKRVKVTLLNLLFSSFTFLLINSYS